MTTASPPRTLAVVVPVYGNEDTLPELVDRLTSLALPTGVLLEAVFVVDGSPDRSEDVLREILATSDLDATLVVLSRNFGSFAAIRAGLEAVESDYFAVMAADLQEPPELAIGFVEALETGDFDIVLGERQGRDDPTASKLSSNTFWSLYRRFVQPEMPVGGVDVFGCNAAARDAILQLRESHSSLVGLLLWVGFRRTTIGYQRLPRPSGESGWTFSKKVRYMSDSIFAFTDLPIRMLLVTGVLGCAAVTILAMVVLTAWAIGSVSVPGYAPLMLTILFVGGLLTLGLGIVGSYVWRTYENTKFRPATIELSRDRFTGGTRPGPPPDTP